MFILVRELDNGIVFLYLVICEAHGCLSEEVFEKNPRSTDFSSRVDACLSRIDMLTFFKARLLTTSNICRVHYPVTKNSPTLSSTKKKKKRNPSIQINAAIPNYYSPISLNICRQALHYDFSKDKEIEDRFNVRFAREELGKNKRDGSIISGLSDWLVIFFESKFRDED